MSQKSWPWLILFMTTLESCNFYRRMWIDLFANPQWQGVDFIIFYTAGRLAQTAPLSELYDLEHQRAVQLPLVGPNLFGGDPLPFNHPPFLAPLIGFFINADYMASYIRWVLFLTAIVFVTALLLAARFRHAGAKLGPAVMVGVGALIFYPSFISLLKGHDTALIILGAVGCFYALGRNWSLTAGLALGLTVIKPQLALALALPLMLTNRRAGLGFLLAAGGLALVSVMMVGGDGVRDYLTLIILSNSGTGYGLNQHAMFNLVGLVLRAAPQIDRTLLSVVKWGAFFAGIGGVCWYWWSRRDRLGDREFGVAALVAVIVSPHLHLHDLSLTLLAVVALALVWHRAGGYRAAVAPLVPVLASMALLGVSFLPNDLNYGATYLLLGALFVALIVEEYRWPPLLTGMVQKQRV